MNKNCSLKSIRTKSISNDQCLIIKENLKNHGVSVIKNLFTNEQIIKFKNVYSDTKKYVDNEITTSKSKIYNYYAHFDKEYCYKKKFYDINGYEIIEINKDRYDIGLPFDLNENENIDQIVKQFIKKQSKSKWGILTSDCKSGNGPWHRDTINLDGDADEDGRYDDSNVVHNFSPFYFTILIPLVDMNESNGSTEFILGSHKLTYSECTDKVHKQFNTKLGDAIIFDGRIFHRGRENKTNHARPVIYNMVHRDWYVETGD